MSNLPDSSKTYIPFQFDKIIKLVKANPNDMDLGKAVRKLIEDYNEEIVKPSITDDYTQ